jgi:D-inositol-3-phosphate glycosyltransferase
MTKKRIALISEHASPVALPGSVDSGGQNVYVGQVARHLARAGYQVDVFTRRDRADALPMHTWKDGVRIVNVPAGPATFVPKEQLLPFMDEFADYMRRFMLAGRPHDLVHANFFMSGLVGCQLKRWLGTPLVVTFHALGKVRLLHQGKADGFPRERLEIEQRAMREADVIVAECPEDEHDQVSLYHADSRKIRVVPCGFDPLELGPIDKRIARERLGLEPNEFTVLQLGRMVPRKGVDNAIRGVAELYRGGDRDVRLLVVGGDSESADPIATPEIGRLMGIAEQEGIADRVTFVGQRGRDVIRYYYSASDVFVTTPWYEPFGITPLEAMACGTPVVGSDVGGIKYTVRDGVTGYLVPPRDPAALADRLRLLYRNPKRREQLSRQAIQWVNAQFTWRKVSAQLAEVYEELLSRQVVVRVPASAIQHRAPDRASTASSDSVEVG